MRKLRFEVAVALALAVFASCGSTNSKPCGPATCATGCCDASGTCQPGSFANACGLSGGLCASCFGAQVCSLGQCTLTSGAGGGVVGTGGGTSGTGGGTVSTGGGTVGTGGGTVSTGGGTSGTGGGTVSTGGGTVGTGGGMVGTGGGTAGTGGGGPLVCSPACPAGYSCTTGICGGGDLMMLSLDVQTYTMSGKVTLNAANPVSSTTSCLSSGSLYYPRGTVTFTEPTRGYSLSYDLDGCESTVATFSGRLFPGTYKVTVRGRYSDLPNDSYVVNPSLTVSGNVTALVLDVQTYTVSGKVTLNTANPVSSTTSCLSSGSLYYPRGTVTFTDSTKGYSLSYDVDGCEAALATFSGRLFPGTYKVTVRGRYSDLPNDSYVVNPSLTVSGNVTALVLDVQTYTVGGKVTLNTANPVSSTTSCLSSGSLYYPRGTVTFTEPTKGYSLSYDLDGCEATLATFSGRLFPGTYKVTVRGRYSDLPNDSYVVNPSLTVSGNVTALVLDVQTYSVDGKVTLNTANPVSSTTSCLSSGSLYYPRGTVTFTEPTKGYSLSYDLDGCEATLATFRGRLFAGTYKVTVRGRYSDLPNDSYVVNPSLTVSGNVSALVLDVQTYTVGGKVTLNTANPVSSTTSCLSSGSLYYPRGTVTFTDSTRGYSLSYDLDGCESTVAAFSGRLFAGTYKVTVRGRYSDLPNDSYVVNPSLTVSGNVTALVLDVQTYTVSGKVTLNTANPVSSTTSCLSSGSLYYPRGTVTFTEPTKGYSLSYDLDGCESTVATFSGRLFPGTYKVTVRGRYSDLPNDSYVVVSKLQVP